MINPFIDAYRLTSDEEKELLDILGNKGMALLQKFFVYKSSVLRDRSMSAKEDEETRQFKWGAAAVLSMAADFPNMVVKRKSKEDAEAVVKAPKVRRKSEKVFGPDSAVI